MELKEIREKLHEWYGGENKPIIDGHYDPSLAVRCVNGTFVGRKTENVTAFRGIPYVGSQPVGDLRWKAPENKRVMVFDEFDIHPAKEADVKIVDWERTYFLTKYGAL